MRKAYYCFILFLLWIACGEPTETRKQVATPEADTDNNTVKVNPVDTVTIVPIEDTIPIHVFAKDETLWELANTYYGNRHYSSIMKIYNEIEDESHIKAGSLIKIPELSTALKDPRLKLYPFIGNEMDQLMIARNLFMLHEKRLYEIREEQHMKQPLDMPATMQKDILQAADLIDQAISSIKTKEAGPTKDRKRMIGQLLSVSTYMKSLGNGNHDTDYGYDIDMVHQRLIHAIHNGIAWAKQME